MISAYSTLIGYDWTVRKFRCSSLVCCLLLPLRVKVMDASALSLEWLQQVCTAVGLAVACFQRKAKGSKIRSLLWFLRPHYSIDERMSASATFQKHFYWYQSLSWHDWMWTLDAPGLAIILCLRLTWLHKPWQLHTRPNPYLLKANLWF